MHIGVEICDEKGTVKVMSPLEIREPWGYFRRSSTLIIQIKLKK